MEDKRLFMARQKPTRQKLFSTAYDRPVHSPALLFMKYATTKLPLAIDRYWPEEEAESDPADVG